MDCSPPGSSVQGILQARILEWVAISSSGDLPDPGIEPSSPALQADSLPSEPPGKPKNTEVGSLSLLQGIFLTQESNQGLLHCRHFYKRLKTFEIMKKDGKTKGNLCVTSKETIYPVKG